MNRDRLVPLLAAVVLAGAVAGCGDDDDGAATLSFIDVPETVAMGVLPDPLQGLPTLPAPPPPPTTVGASTTTTVAELEPIEPPISPHVDGNRFLLLGDGLLASAVGGDDDLMCDALTIFGWESEIDAAPDRGLEQLAADLDDRLAVDGDPEWDVVGLLFGNELDGTDPDAVEQFRAWLDSTLEQLSPIPVIVYTLSEIDDGRVAINDTIVASQAEHLNAVLIDWATAGGDPDDVVDETGLELTDDGQKRLSVLTAAALGEAPGAADGSCAVSGPD
jgi:hypothetical protein